jgi:hypothetical protein
MPRMGTVSTVRGRPSVRAIFVLLLVLTLTIAACSQGGGKAQTADRQDAARQYAQCMRDNGVPDFPDPDPDGQFRGTSHDQQNDPKFRAASDACSSLAPGGEHENTGDPAFVNQMRKYAQCMRDNGVPDFPDPDANGQFRGSSHEQQNDPKFRAASEACRRELPGGGEHQ